MSKEIAHRPGTDFSTLLEEGDGPETARALVEARSEQDLSPSQFDLIEKASQAPAPDLELATADDIRKIVGELAGSLKHQRHSREEGELKLSAYYRALRGLPLRSIGYAADKAIKESDWMPGQATLRKYALEYDDPILQLRRKAIRFVQEREGRLFRELVADLQAKRIPEEDLPSIDRGYWRQLEYKRLIIVMDDGSIHYWTAELETRRREARAAITREIREQVAEEFEQRTHTQGDDHDDEKSD